jgi:hypothetical protein
VAAFVRTAVRYRSAIMIALAGVVFLGSADSLHAQQGTLDAIRSDVRDAPPPSAQQSPSSSSNNSNNSSSGSSLSLSDDNTSLAEACEVVIGGIVTSPFWAPHMALDDNFSARDYFPLYP